MARSIVRERGWLAPLGVCLLLTAAAASTYAQMSGIDPDPGVSFGGTNIIEGRIYLPSNQPPNKRMRVRLNSVRSGEYSTLTDDNGAFAFRRLAAGAYTVTVEADANYQSAQESVTFGGGSGRFGRGQAVIRVELRLRPKDAKNTGKPAVVDAATADVPKPVRDLYHEALRSAQAGKSEAAVAQLQKALAIEPTFAPALNELGVQYMRQGKLDEAAAALRSALKITPDAFAPRLNLGVVLCYQKEYAESERELGTALEKNESSVPARLYRGRALIALRRHAEAEKELSRTAAMGGVEASAAYRYLGALYIETGRRERAVESLESYLRLVPNPGDEAQIRRILEQLKTNKAVEKR